MWITVDDGSVSSGAEQLGFRSLITAYRKWAPEGGFSYQHLPEWVCEEMTKNRLQ